MAINREDEEKRRAQQQAAAAKQAAANEAAKQQQQTDPAAYRGVRFGSLGNYPDSLADTAKESLSFAFKDFGYTGQQTSTPQPKAAEGQPRQAAPAQQGTPQQTNRGLSSNGAYEDRAQKPREDSSATPLSALNPLNPLGGAALVSAATGAVRKAPRTGTIAKAAREIAAKALAAKEEAAPAQETAPSKAGTQEQRGQQNKEQNQIRQQADEAKRERMGASGGIPSGVPIQNPNVEVATPTPAVREVSDLATSDLPTPQALGGVKPSTDATRDRIERAMGALKEIGAATKAAQEERERQRERQGEQAGTIKNVEAWTIEDGKWVKKDKEYISNPGSDTPWDQSPLTSGGRVKHMIDDSGREEAWIINGSREEHWTKDPTKGDKWAKRDANNSAPAQADNRRPDRLGNARAWITNKKGEVEHLQKNERGEWERWSKGANGEWVKTASQAPTQARETRRTAGSREGTSKPFGNGDFGNAGQQATSNGSTAAKGEAAPAQGTSQQQQQQPAPAQAAGQQQAQPQQQEAQPQGQQQTAQPQGEAETAGKAADAAARTARTAANAAGQAADESADVAGQATDAAANAAGQAADAATNAANAAGQATDAAVNAAEQTSERDVDYVTADSPTLSTPKAFDNGDFGNATPQPSNEYFENARKLAGENDYYGRLSETNERRQRRLDRAQRQAERRVAEYSRMTPSQARNRAIRLARKADRYARRGKKYEAELYKNEADLVLRVSSGENPADAIQAQSEEAEDKLTGKKREDERAQFNIWDSLDKSEQSRYNNWLRAESEARRAGRDNAANRIAERRLAFEEAKFREIQRNNAQNNAKAAREQRDKTRKSQNEQRQQAFRDDKDQYDRWNDYYTDLLKKKETLTQNIADYNALQELRAKSANKDTANNMTEAELEQLKSLSKSSVGSWKPEDVTKANKRIGDINGGINQASEMLSGIRNKWHAEYTQRAQQTSKQKQKTQQTSKQKR